MIRRRSEGACTLGFVAFVLTLEMLLEDFPQIQDYDKVCNNRILPHIKIDKVIIDNVIKMNPTNSFRYLDI